MSIHSCVSIIVTVYFLLAIPAIGSLADNKTANVLKPMDIFDLEFATDPEISPDGGRIAYVRNFFDVMTDKKCSNIWIMNFDGSGHEPLTSGKGNASSPRWSADGMRLAYVTTDKDNRSQIFCRWMDSGETANLSNLQKPPGNLSWSPDGTQIAFTMPVPVKKKLEVDLPEKPEGAKWAKPAKIIEQMIYRFDGEGYLDDGYNQIFVLPSEGGTPRQVTSNDHPNPHFYDIGKIEWSNDSRFLLFSTNLDKDWEHNLRKNEIVELNLKTEEVKPLTNRQGPDYAPHLSPDDDQIAYLGFDEEYFGYQTINVYLMKRDGGNPHQIVKEINKSIMDIEWEPSGKGLYLQFIDEGIAKLAYAEIDGDTNILADHLGFSMNGKPYTPFEESGEISFSIAKHNRFVATIRTPYHPSDLVAGVREEQNLKQLTTLNEDVLGYKKLGKVETFTYDVEIPNKPTETIQGWIIKPPEFDPDNKYPLILDIHGGPFAAYGPNFTPELQLMAAAGYVVLYVNPRGSTSYTERFAQLIQNDYPGDDYHDLMAGVDYVIKQGYIQKDNLFVTGGSAGGIMTTWVVGHTDRFRAAAACNPVVYEYSACLTGDDYPYWIKYFHQGFPWDKPDYYKKSSSITHVGNVNTPTILITGEQDYRTPISETEMFYQALKLRKIDTAMVRVPEASHHLSARPSYLISKVEHTLAWFDKYRLK